MLSVSQNFSRHLARARVKAAVALKRILLGRVVADPLSIIRTLEGASYRGYVGKHIAQAMVIADPLIVTYPFPEEFPFAFRRSKAFDTRYLYTLTDVCVSSITGQAWLPEGYLLLESVGSFYRALNADHQAKVLQHTQSLSFEEPIAVFHPSINYYHWMFEVLPKFCYVRSVAPEAKFLVPIGGPRYFTDALAQLLNPEELRSKLLFYDQPVQVSRFLMVTHDRFVGITRPQDLKVLRSIVQPVIDETTKNKLIYISRRKASARRLVNEKQMEEALNSLGFTIVYCEEMSWLEQIKLFTQARFIVAPHGAGLSNIVWATECTVLEIFPNRILPDTYALLSISLGFTYDYVECDFDQTSYGKINVGLVLDKLKSLMMKQDEIV
jgi:hypothetical protein